MVTEISHVVDGISRYAPITSLWEEAQVCFPQFYALWPPLWNPSSHWPLITSPSLLCLWPLSPSHCPTLWSYSLWGLRPSIPPYRIHSRRHLTITMYWWVAPVSKIFPPPTRAPLAPHISLFISHSVPVYRVSNSVPGLKDAMMIEAHRPFHFPKIRQLNRTLKGGLAA